MVLDGVRDGREKVGSVGVPVLKVVRKVVSEKGGVKGMLHIVGSNGMLQKVVCSWWYVDLENVEVPMW